jgi:hypothetical protein
MNAVFFFTSIFLKLPYLFSASTIIFKTVVSWYMRPIAAYICLIHLQHVDAKWIYKDAVIDLWTDYVTANICKVLAYHYINNHFVLKLFWSSAVLASDIIIHSKKLVINIHIGKRHIKLSLPFALPTHAIQCWLYNQYSVSSYTIR